MLIHAHCKTMDVLFAIADQATLVIDAQVCSVLHSLNSVVEFHHISFVFPHNIFNALI